MNILLAVNVHHLRNRYMCSHSEFWSWFQSDRQSHLSLQVELSQVKHLLSQDLLLLHPPDAVQAEADGIVPNGLLFDSGELECFGKDRARTSLHASLCPLLFRRQQYQVDLPGYVACLLECWNVCGCGHCNSQVLLARVILEGHVQCAVFAEWLWLVCWGEESTRTILNKQKEDIFSAIECNSLLFFATWFNLTQYN